MLRLLIVKYIMPNPYTTSWERGNQQAHQGLWVRLPQRQFPAGSEVGRWARERLRCGEWDAWLRNPRACLPRAPAGVVGAADTTAPDLCAAMRSRRIEEVTDDECKGVQHQRR